MEQSPEAEIRYRIARRGKITFAEFMEVALYHPSGGYYTNASAFGASGDYFTSPAAHPAFGALLAVQLRRMWEVMGCPTPFYVVEMGAGSSILARDVVAYALRMPGFAEPLRYLALDRYRTADESSDMQHIIADSIPLKGVTGCFVSNELVDAFPVHRFQIHRGTVKETYVTLGEGGRLAEALDEPSTPLLAQRIGDLGLALPEGFRGEVNLNIGPWMKGVSDALEKGFVITIDYGYEAEELYSPARSRGTLQTYYRHTQASSPYQRIGQQDITAHVDFSLIASEGAALGLKPLVLLTQAQFLKDLGFNEMLARLRTMELSQRERNANLLAMRELVKPEGLGGFKVLIQERSTGVEEINDLNPTEAVGATCEPPLLRPEHIRLMEGRYPHLGWEAEEPGVLG